MLRSDHPEAVFSSMEGIMSLVLAESEEIPLDLICLLLDSVKKVNTVPFFVCFILRSLVILSVVGLICSLFQDISPLSWKLGESVITNCAATLKPYLMKAVKSLGLNVDDYAQIVVSVCQNGEEDLRHKSASDAKDNLVGHT